MARRPRSGAVAGAVLSCRVLAAGSNRRYSLPEQGRNLRHPVQGFGRDHAHHRGRSQTPRRPHRYPLGLAHLGIRDDPEPSLMILGIIISLIFSEQRKLVFRAPPPLQN